MSVTAVGQPVTSTGPGRVNLIGDHTDYNGGLALPLAIGLGTTVMFTPTGADSLAVTSDAYPGQEIVLPVVVDVDTITTIGPSWARLVAAVVGLARPTSGGTVHISTTLPLGAGLSSSAALAVALADGFGVTGSPLVVATMVREAEHRTGVPVGLMDPLVCAGGRQGHAMRIDCSTPSFEHVPLPSDVEVVVVDSTIRRDLRTSEYAVRVAECEAAAAVIGPLGRALPTDLVGLRDPVLRRRARHVITECARVDAMIEALAVGDIAEAGAQMDESHRSLAGDFAVSTPDLDDLVARIRARPGVLGARMTGAGFGGCVVALTEPGTLDLASIGRPAWRVEAVDGTVTARIGREGSL